MASLIGSTAHGRTRSTSAWHSPIEGMSAAAAPGMRALASAVSATSVYFIVICRLYGMSLLVDEECERKNEWTTSKKVKILMYQRKEEQIDGYGTAPSYKLRYPMRSQW
jgi:hypothetical protein